MRTAKVFFRYLLLLSATAAILAFTWVFCLSVVQDFFLSTGMDALLASGLAYFVIFVIVGIFTFFGIRFVFYEESDGKRPRRGR